MSNALNICNWRNFAMSIITCILMKFFRIAIQPTICYSDLSLFFLFFFFFVFVTQVSLKLLMFLSAPTVEIPLFGNYSRQSLCFLFLFLFFPRWEALVISSCVVLSISWVTFVVCELQFAMALFDNIISTEIAASDSLFSSSESLDKIRDITLVYYFRFETGIYVYTFFLKYSIGSLNPLHGEHEK